MELTKNPESGSASPFSAVISMFYEPASTFAAIETRRAAWLPLLLLMLSTATLMVWYFNIVDFAWLMDQMFATVKDQAAREKAAAMMTKQAMQISGLAGALIGLPVMFALVGVYLMFVGKMYSKQFTFGKGFALAAWSSLPSLLALPLGAMQIMLASSGQMVFSELNPLSLNTLFFHYPMSHPAAALFDSFSVISIWSAVLMVIGFQIWAKVTRAAAVKVVAIPYVVIYGAWLAFALNSAA